MRKKVGIFLVFLLLISLSVIKGKAVTSELPNATVEYKDSSFCSSETEVVIRANATCSYDAYWNDNLVYSSEVLEIGKDYTHAFSGLLEGENTFSIVIIDADGNRSSYPKSLICDKTPPRITFKYEYDGAVVRVNKLIIEGYVKDCSELFVDDNTVTFSSDGHFEYEVELHNGENEIIVSAYDIAKNLTSAKLHLKCSLPVTKKKPDATSIIGLILIIIAAVLFVIKGKQHSSTPPKDFTSESKRRYKRNDNLRTVLLMGIVVAVFIIIGLFVVQISYIPSDSMNPHICAGDYNIGKRSFIGGTKNINRGDVIMFVHQGEPLVKRVIGLPGEVVTFVNGKVAINGEILDEPYLDDNVITKCNNTYTVPDGCYFVLGDNRMYSSDSRTDNQLSSPFFNSPFVPKSEITSVEILVIPTHGFVKSDKN